ncbi:DUF1697 domain-containing protein [Colwellia hornerae]|uniref:DUF1697 domain-containing protein n=1 Tax=Colwellia hornerae TaxID=89402 RepID=A0A5C6QRJ4_9GAMM|nr:DUF1697 domain-containing protein [Colwellia hornerae]TWX55716.1 DUF1697 domain-containing protein [Colwellia hornerae]TWX61926.1 DUF1697 domain-containing protein [Colwellia hornerae]TWX71258.1 DUF1697 domain-containing protein [Colwellia hornerae]
MAELTILYQSLMLENINTYIQSGNVVFQSANNKEELKSSLETAIHAYFNFDVEVLILTKSELANTANKLPFSDINIEQEGSKILIFFLSKKVSDDQTQVLARYLTNAEQLVIGKEVIYLYCPQGLGKSKLTNKLIEKKLQLTATARNIKTVHKLLLLCDG